MGRWEGGIFSLLVNYVYVFCQSFIYLPLLWNWQKICHIVVYVRFRSNHVSHNGCRVLSYCWVRKIAKLEFENFVLLLHAELLLKQREPMKAFETRGSLWNTRRNSRRLFKSFFTAKAAQPYWIHCSLSGTTVIWILVSCPAPCPPPYATRSAKTRVTCR